jgi:SAM-dependent methyltransferase
MISHQATASSLIQIAKDLRFDLNPGMKVLDFGAGAGGLVNAFSEMGYEAFGVDIMDYFEQDKQFFRLIELNPYRIPYEDNTFDFVVSTSVFEHTMNHEECFSEIHRVLKPNGASLHIIPSRWCLPVEPHMFVPFATVIQSKGWLSFWAFMGIRNGFQKGKHWREVAAINKAYCETGIKYLPWKNIQIMVASIFGNVTFAKKEYMRHAQGRGARLMRKLPVPWRHKFFFMFREGAVFMRKTT